MRKVEEHELFKSDFSIPEQDLDNSGYSYLYISSSIFYIYSVYNRSVPKNKQIADGIIQSHARNITYCLLHTKSKINGDLLFDWNLFKQMVKDLDGFFFEYHSPIKALKYIVGPPVGQGGMGLIQQLCIENSPNDCYVYKEPRYGSKIPLLIIAKEILIGQWLSCKSCHSYFVESYGCKIEGDNIYIYMRKMDGSLYKLRETLDYKNPKHEAIILQINKFIVTAVNQLHSYGFIYFDLKPQNILYHQVGSAYTFTLADFGVSEVYGLKDYNDAGRTKQYAPPDVYYSFTADIYVVDYFAVACCIIEHFSSRRINEREHNIIEHRALELFCLFLNLTFDGFGDYNTFRKFNDDKKMKEYDSIYKRSSLPSVDLKYASSAIKPIIQKFNNLLELCK